MQSSARGTTACRHVAVLNPFLLAGKTASPMVDLRERDRPGFGYHLKVHSFRTLTVILAWAFVVAAFYQKPELLTGAQRLMQRGIEALGDAVPPPWGPRMEFVFREIGGVIWLQITLVVWRCAWHCRVLPRLGGSSCVGIVGRWGNETKRSGFLNDGASKFARIFPDLEMEPAASVGIVVGGRALRSGAMQWLPN